jgi:hypothetical protein
MEPLTNSYSGYPLVKKLEELMQDQIDINLTVNRGNSKTPGDTRGSLIDGSPQ